MLSHMVATTLQAAGLSALSNLLAQAINAHREQRPLVIKLRSLLQFSLFTLISCPPNVLWQAFLEDKFPAYTQSPAFTPGSGDVGVLAQRTLDKGNTARKLLFDQTLGAFVNTLAFVAVMSAFKGRGLKGVQRDVERDVVPLMINSWKLWPAVALVNFTLVPVDRRVIVGSIVGLFWGIYLSMFAALE